MSDDDIFEVATTYADVAELGQGYVDRADGERMLLALPRSVPQGEGVRFIVHLADGTPAFAGAGRCVQVSDQGKAASSEERYETLLDSLVFDERSQPVYEYIVAVRQISYANVEPNAVAGTEDEAVYESEESTAVPRVDAASAPPESLAPVSEVEQLAESEASHGRVAEPETNPAPPKAAVAAHLESEPPPALQSVLPEPLPTGILTRAALAAHWVPAAARPPHRSMRPGNFDYPPGTLPVPDAPPRPELDQRLWVQRAEAPAA
jgi:hypothetical protein